MIRSIKYIFFILVFFAAAGSVFARENNKKSKTAPKEVSANKEALDKLTVENDLYKQRTIKKLRETVDESEVAKAKYGLMMEKQRIKMVALESEQKQLAMENKLLVEKNKKALAEMKHANAEIKLKNEAELELSKLKNAREFSAINFEKKRMELKMARLRFEREKILSETAKLKSDLEMRLKKKEWKNEANKEPEYLLNPFKNGVLTISDRRIALNGPIVRGVADFVTDRIHYFNNKSAKLPIFIVINNSPGGSVMEGVRILKAMDTSQAPVHVIVKSYAASMAAAITTLAPHSYAYPNAIILHHQMSSAVWGNMTEMKERFENTKKWDKRVNTPIAKKMGLSLEAFRKKLYEHNSNADWQEFADRAKKYKWVNNIVNEIRETGYVKNPDVSKKTKPGAKMVEKIDDKGRSYAVLPRLQPFDFYYIYNPDNYYR